MAVSRRDALVAGNVTSSARRFLEEHGAIIEEVDELAYIVLPESADVYHTDNYPPRVFHILFDVEGECEKNTLGVVVEPEFFAFETRVYTSLIA